MQSSAFIDRPSCGGQLQFHFMLINIFLKLWPNPAGGWKSKHVKNIHVQWDKPCRAPRPRYRTHNLLAVTHQFNHSTTKNQTKQALFAVNDCTITPPISASVATLQQQLQGSRTCNFRLQVSHYFGWQYSVIFRYFTQIVTTIMVQIWFQSKRLMRTLKPDSESPAFGRVQSGSQCCRVSVNSNAAFDILMHSTVSQTLTLSHPLLLVCLRAGNMSCLFLVHRCL